ncbi:hypothetical protein AMELA_G00110710 [Ameiurus melas]|uniref:Uncharacterized protein n=1 Tax=Ameiurus melas TaxID=219545 RepID=A0A7J6AQH3_AMEME|nr:hypothetical protein AMELA_G00110710 [Ameiurus melas]
MSYRCRGSSSNTHEQKEVMAGTCLIHCFLIQVLLITVYAALLGPAVNCPNHNGTMEQPLHLTCNVTCKNKCASTYIYKWEVNKTQINCSEQQNRNITDGNSHTFNCTIESALPIHNGTFTFWVQMNNGVNKTTFNVTIVPAANPTTTSVVSTTNSHAHNEKVFVPEGRSPKVALAVVLMICLALGVIVAVLFRRNNNCNMSISSIFTRNMITETEVI